ncbi:arylsulfatase [Sphingobium sufflavum]|nr:arylsulfatase [Sphingobium sufflavum]
MASAQAKEAPPPNFLIIVADDLGFSDLGAFGGEIRTPRLDDLARKGVRFTDFHTAPACSPTRAMLLTGTDPHRVGLGAMELTTPNQRGKRGLEGYLRPDNATLAELLGANGYSTFLSGKWHLGSAPGQDPHDRGFQRSFAVLPAAHNHFGLGLATDPAKGVTYTEDGRIVPQLPADFYSSDYFAQKMIGFLREAAKRPDKARPFFAYLAFTAPHAPLQARPQDIARYRGRYDAGFDALRDQRLARQAKLGLYDPSKPAHDRAKPQGGWDALTPAQKAQAAREMEIYAAMVERLDHDVGLVIAELRRTKHLDNTVILFLSDNGPEGMDYADNELPSLRRRYEQADNRLDNLGAATSFVGYGPGWAGASAAPSWLYKTYATEGGTRSVSFLSGPGHLVGPGRIARAFLTAADVGPTFLDMAGVARPSATFDGRTIEAMEGTSLRPYLTGKAQCVHAPDEAFGTELFGSRSIRKGDWKITDTGDGQWHLFNLAADPGETHDLSASNDAKLTELMGEWDRYAERVGVVLPTGRSHSP